MEEKDYFNEYPPIDEEDLYGVAASSYDCTGLIPRGLQDEAELESYDDIYPMGAGEEEL